ncbi:MAG: UvrB/UvrC motif-containing protein, partial [Myxococcales bacterium]|nr:UvrB/UvrC motif-containing protein [Myxococcales bacterium]
EGLDIPEVSLVAILDADKEGFLRSPRSLIQTIGRAARNANGEVFMYADRITDAMRVAIDETNRRRELQAKYNEEHGITPKTIQKAVASSDPHAAAAADYFPVSLGPSGEDAGASKAERIASLRAEMLLAAEGLDFEKAARLRDQAHALEGTAAPSPGPRPTRGRGRSNRPPRR